MIPQEKIDQLAEAALRADTDVSSPAEPLVSPAVPAATGIDVDLQAELDAREKRLKKKHVRQSRSVTLVALAAIAGVGAWYFVSPSFKAKVDGFVRNIRQSGEDVKSIGSMTEAYDKQLEKVAAHGGQLDQATRSLGADPTQASADDPNFDKQVTELTGEDPSAAGRTKQLQEKFGGARKLAGKHDGESSQP